MSAMSYPTHLPLSGETPMATLTHPTASIWQLELHAGPHNTLTSFVITECVMVALDLVERDWRSSASNVDEGQQLSYAPGALVLTGTRGHKSKYFSRGLNPTEARSNGFTFNVLQPLLNRLLSFPLPTVAAINGHAFAGGFFVALACDYRVMESGGPVALMTELMGSFPITPALGAFLNAKLPSSIIERKTMLEGHRWTAEELEAIGLVDVVVPRNAADQTLDAARELIEGKASLATRGVWGTIRQEMHKSVFAASVDDVRVVFHNSDQRKWRESMRDLSTRL